MVCAVNGDLISLHLDLPWRAPGADIDELVGQRACCGCARRLCLYRFGVTRQVSRTQSVIARERRYHEMAESMVNGRIRDVLIFVSRKFQRNGFVVILSR